MLDGNPIGNEPVEERSETAQMRPRRRTWIRRLTKRIATFWQMVFPKGRHVHTPTRDLVADAQAAEQLKAAVVRNAIVYLPVVGILLVGVNLLVQARGNVGVAVAVVQNLSLGALALVVVLNLSTYFMYGLVVGLLPVIVDSEYSAGLRQTAGSIVFLLCLVMLHVVPGAIYIAIVGFLVLARYTVWRLDRRVKHATVEGPSMAQVLRNSPPPVDLELRRIWAAGRTILRRAGVDFLMRPEDLEMQNSTVPRTLEEVRNEWNDRHSAIARPKKKTATTVAFAVLVTFVSAYGLTIVISPIRFAPLESVVFGDEKPVAGYLLLGSSTTGVFLPRNGLSIRHVDPQVPLTRAICAAPDSIWTRPLVVSWTGDGGGNETVDCSGI